MASRWSELPEEQEGAPPRARRASRLLLALTPRVATAVTALLVAALCIVAARYYASVRSDLTDVVMARRAAVAQLAAATLSERLDRMLDVGVSLATRVRFAELVAAGQWDAAVQILKSVPTEFRFVERLFLADVRGTVMADVPELNTRGQNFAHRDWFQGVSQAWKPYVSGLYRRTAAPQRALFAVAVPVLDRAAAPTGILVLQIRLDSFFDWARAIDPGPGAAVYIVDGKGAAAFDSRSPSSTEITDLAANPAVARLLRGESGVETIAGHVYAFMPGRHGWDVVVEQPAAQAFAARDAQLRFIQFAYALTALFLVALAWLGLQELQGTRRSLARHAERLRMLHEIDRAVLAEETPEAIAAAVVQPLRELLGVPRAIVNRFDLAAGEVEWIAAAGRRRVHVGPGVRYSIQLMGNVDALRRGETQLVDVPALAAGPERDALLASDVQVYMVVPMIAGGELLGALSFGGRSRDFPQEQVNIVREVAAQLAIAIAQARLLASVRGHAAELETRVRARTVELQMTNKELEAFSYSVSHDLRAPLRAVDGYARMLEEDYGQTLDAEGQRLLRVVREASHRMGRLIDDLLAFSKLGRQQPARRRVDMGALAAEVVAELRGESKAAIEIAPLPAAEADPAMLKQVLTNLIGNALKYSGKREHPAVEIAGKVEGEEAVYWVRDNGAGFDMRYAEKLFGVFQRLHRQDEFPGTGVGLAIVQRVITRHGGRVWAEGKPGEGACFYFSLPRQTE
ncbi:MAG TPA: ATP-binding protein [Burkholderiales bacterium]|nr:ATP-binding protein [Burkholderiales bacterium]